jgi:nucleotide-binding universal stress UspA family protein
MACDRSHVIRNDIHLFLILIKFGMAPIKINSIKRILVPTDFSVSADNALSYAVALAQNLKAKLTLFHSVRVPLSAVGEVPEEFSPNQLQKDARGQLESIRKQLKALDLQVDIEAETTIGLAVDEIIAAVEANQSDLVIMGTKGSSGIMERLIGSNAADVIEKAKCPVLVIPEEAKFKSIDRIVFATNYVDNDFQSLYLLVEMFKTFNPEIIVLHVEEETQYIIENNISERFQKQVASSIPYDNFHFKIINGKKVMESLNDFLLSEEIDLLALSTRRRGFISKFFDRGLTRKLACHTNIPLMAFHIQQNNESSK